MFGNKILGASLLATTALVAVPVFAQTAPTADAASPAPPVGTAPIAAPPTAAPIDSNPSDIIVTARRRDEKLQDVPVAITAVRGDQLQRLSIVKGDDLPRVTPGMVVSTSVYGASNLTVTIRSQRQALNNGSYDSSVGVYFDEVPQARTQGLNAGFFDLQSVQVLKGPQGTLFGRNTTGGAVLITSQAPTDQFEGYGQVTYGNYNTVDFEGAINLPVNDKLEIRAAGKITRHDGYIYSTTEHDKIGDLSDESWRISAKFMPTETLTNSLVVSGFHENDDGTVFKITAVNPTSNAALIRGQADQLALLDTRDFWTTTAANTPHGTQVKTLTISNITTLDLGDVAIKNIFGYRRTRASIDFNIDGDADPSYLIKTIDNGDQYSDELNLSGKAFGNKLDYFAGLFFFKEDNASSQLTTNRISVPLTSTAPGVIGNAIADPITNTSYSAYAQATYHFGDSGFSATGGIRYTKDKREIVWRSVFLTPAPVCRLVTQVTPAGSTTPVTVPLDPCIRTGSVSYSRPTFTATLDYKASPDFLFYGTYRRGYRSGGFTFTAVNPFDSLPYRPETVDDFEIGAKGVVRFSPDVRLRFDIAGYYDIYKDIQRQLTDVTKPIVAVYFVNAAKAHIKGVELSGDLDIGKRLNLSGSFALSDAKYTSFIAPGPGGTIVNYTKAPFAGAPKYTATWLARYELSDVEGVGRFFVQGSGYYQSKTVSQDGASFDPVAQNVYQRDVQSGRQVIDARVEWAKVFDHPLDIQFYVKNLTKTKYFVQINDSYTSNSFGNTGAILGDPRTFGVVIKYHF